MTLTYGKGYSGNAGHKCWIAKILGSDNQFGLQREFLDADKVERQHFNRARTMIDFTFLLEEGLYESSERGEREFFIVFLKKDEACWTRINDDRVKAIASLLDEGKTFTEARKATKPPVV
jgi:hypothetical protein